MPDLLPTDYSSKPVVTDEQAAGAQRTVAARALDAEDCHYLLDALGILPASVET